MELSNKSDYDEDPYEGDAPVPDIKIKKYQRANNIDFHKIKTANKKLDIRNTNEKYQQSARQTARNELFLTEEPGYIEPDEDEDTYRIKQVDIAQATDITSASKLFTLKLTEFGPYKIKYSRDGRHLLLGGQRGHLAAMDWVTKQLFCEINVMQSIHDICWLHQPTMFAAAQKDWVYIYDNKGTELHCIKKLSRVLQMQFLPYHFLLTTASEKGFLAWLDISVGKMVKETYTKAGRLNVLSHNPYNAVIATGHANGTVSMWSPNIDKPLVRALCHTHPIRSIAFDRKGLYMATASVDRSVKIFDVRTYKCLQSYKLGGAPGFLDFSQLELLAVGHGNVVEVFKDCCREAVKKPYLRHRVPNTISGMHFCPYEDVLGIGFSYGFNSILTPGAGEPNFDSYESNPFQTKTQRREMEVKSLLEKIQPEFIGLDPGSLGHAHLPDNLKEAEEKNEKPSVTFKPRQKGKGRSKSATVFKRKTVVRNGVIRDYVKSAVQESQERAPKKTKVAKFENVLDRFQNKKKKV